MHKQVCMLGNANRERADAPNRSSLHVKKAQGLSQHIYESHLDRWSVGVDPPKIHMPPFPDKVLSIFVSLFALTYLRYGCRSGQKDKQGDTIAPCQDWHCRHCPQIAAVPEAMPERSRNQHSIQIGRDLGYCHV